MKNLSLAPPITCRQCGALVFPYCDEQMFRGECQNCGHKITLSLQMCIPRLTNMSASKRFQELCADIEKQGKSGQLLEILEQNFSDFLAYVESEEMKRCDALAIGVNTLATLAVLKHI